MINLGKINKLRVVKREVQGFYLEGDDESGDVLLPNKFAPEDLSVDDEIDVFIHLDSEDRLMATTQNPKAVVGEFAFLEVSAVEEIGVFLDWGLDKNLFVPHREQMYEMQVGKSYVVYLYIDSSDRIAATTRLTKNIETSPPMFSKGEVVDLLLCQFTDLGIKAIINGTHYGLIFRDDVVNHLQLGDKIKGFIKNIREDGKIDLSLRPLSGGTRDELSELILQKLRESGGELAINSKSSAEEINSIFKVSRKKFKVALGNLYKNKVVATDDSGTRILGDSNER